MKICNVVTDTGMRLGVVQDDSVAVTDMWESTDAYIKDTSPKRGERLKQAILESESLATGKATVGPALIGPGKVICIGLNYRRHAEETGADIPKAPVVFSKFSDSVAASGDAITIPAVTHQLDYEAELAMVIGREAYHVTEEDALNYVFGYCNANDISARDLQFVNSQWLLGKTGSGFAPLGPFIKTADQVPNPDGLRIRMYRNEELVQNSNTADMIFSCRQIIAYLSHHMVLMPGDVVLTGTPEGVIMGAEPTKRKWLTAGERLTVEIEGLGELKNILVEE